MDTAGNRLTRRGLLTRGAVAGLSGGAIGAAPSRAEADGAPAVGSTRSGRGLSAPPVGLPSPQRIRRELTRMGEFGPRLAPSAAHGRYVDWLSGEFERAGLHLLPRTRCRTDPRGAGGVDEAVIAVLPGRSPETIIFNTHTDGQGIVAGNAGFAFVHLARHFASLPASRRLERTLVFAACPGRVVGGPPRAPRWIDAHPQLVKRAAAAMTVEHLGGRDGDLDRLDEHLAARQIRRLADLATRLDTAPADKLRWDDPPPGAPA